MEEMKKTQISQKRRKKKSPLLKFLFIPLLAVLIAFGFVSGWVYGSTNPVPFVNQLRGIQNATTKADSSAKISEVMNIMKHSWYFGKDIEDIDTRLTDQALAGITSNSEDPHTEYMSAEKIASFFQSINRNFIGIGVTFQLTSGEPLIISVIKDSPAEAAGVQAGDILYSVNGEPVAGLGTTEIKEMVTGEEGTSVTIVLKRGDEKITKDIIRKQIAYTVSGTQLDDIGYLNILQFGETTASEMDAFLKEFEEAGIQKLIIDLRDDGGGYLETLDSVISYYLPKNSVYIQREYADGTRTENRTSGDHYTGFGPIIILVNQNTASAAEAFTIAMSEQRDDVTIVGATNTYGKGTVQLTRYFTDQSAIKYTDSRWLSPNGVWVNEVGIEPDVIVEKPEILTASYIYMDEDEVFTPDSVSECVRTAQLCLEYLNMSADRKDGYFSAETSEQIRQFQQEQELDKTGNLDRTTYDTLIAQVIYQYQSDPSRDLELEKAKEILSQE